MARSNVFTSLAVPIEIERRFLVVGDAWRSEVTSVLRLRDVILCRSDAGKVRVRIRDGWATLTFKGPRMGRSRTECEIPIHVSDAERLFACAPAQDVIERERHIVRNKRTVWSVDVFRGELAGVVWAEVELDDEDQVIDVPAWLGAEVTNDAMFSLTTMLTVERACC